MVHTVRTPRDTKSDDRHDRDRRRFPFTDAFCRRTVDFGSGHGSRRHENFEEETFTEGSTVALYVDDLVETTAEDGDDENTDNRRGETFELVALLGVWDLGPDDHVLGDDDEEGGQPRDRACFDHVIASQLEVEERLGGDLEIQR